MRATHAVLKTAMTRARRWKLIGTNPADDAQPPKAKSKRSVRSLTREEATESLQPSTTRRAATSIPGLPCWCIWRLAAGCGGANCSGSAFDAVDFDTGLLTVKRTVIEGTDRLPILREGKAKTAGSLRTIRLSAPMLDRLRQHKVTILEQRMKWGQDYAEGPLLVFPLSAGSS